jgi:hypothetical protein
MYKIRQSKTDPEMVELFDDCKRPNLWAVLHIDALTDTGSADLFKFGISPRQRLENGETITFRMVEVSG